MPKNISISFSGIITICNLFNRLNRNTASRVISLFEMPLKKIINFVRLFSSTIVPESAEDHGGPLVASADDLVVGV